jgi:hypothetical protein
MSDLGSDMRMMGEIASELREAAYQVRDALKLLRKACRRADAGYRGMALWPGAEVNDILRQVGYYLTQDGEEFYLTRRNPND